MLVYRFAIGKAAAARLPPGFGDTGVAALATGFPGAAAVLRRCGIAFCGPSGARTLGEAVSDNGVSLPAVQGALEDLVGSTLRRAPQRTGALIAYLLRRRRALCRVNLPKLIDRATTIARNGGEARLARDLADLLRALSAAVDEHMLREELRVFPLMRAGRSDRLAEPLALMRAEHADNVQFVLAFERVTCGYRPPAGAGPEWEALYGDIEAALDDFVADVFLEEQVLFPRFEQSAEARPSPLDPGAFYAEAGIG